MHQSSIFYLILPTIRSFQTLVIHQMIMGKLTKEKFPERLIRLFHWSIQDKLESWERVINIGVIFIKFGHKIKLLVVLQN